MRDIVALPGKSDERQEGRCLSLTRNLNTTKADQRKSTPTRNE